MSIENKIELMKLAFQIAISETTTGTTDSDNVIMVYDELVAKINS